MFGKIWLWLRRAALWVWYAGAFYYRLSLLYQRFQLKWAMKGPALPIIRDLGHLEDVLKRMQWRKDTALQWIDTFEHPRAIWAKYMLNPDKGVEDCDGFAIFAADRIEDMIIRHVPVEFGTLKRAYVLTVVWGSGGHNVCAVRYETDEGKECWAHIGNWYGGKIQTGFATLWDVIVAVAEPPVLQWSLATPQLELLAHGWSPKKKGEFQ